MPENTFYREVLYALLAAAAVGVFLLSRDKFRNAFLLFVCTLGLGYRTFALTPSLRIIPAELVLWALPLLALRRGRGPGRAPLPWWLLLMLPFWGLAWLPAPENGFDWDQRLAEFLNFASAVPLFLAAPVMLARPGGWRAVVLTFVGVSVWIAAMGLVEYAFPGVANVLPGFVGNPEPIIADGFQRAKFSFYGSPIGAFICIMALPLAVPMWRWWPTPRARAAIAAGVVLQIAALYISGWRSMWLLLGVQLLLFLVISKRFALGVVVVCVALAGYSFLPAEARNRVHSLELVLQGAPDEADTSGQKRWSRAVDTLHYITQGPMGHGWAASGWSHSDFLQVAANQGLPAGLLFLAGYVVALGRTWWRLCRGVPDGVKEIGMALFLSLVAVGGILLFEGVEIMPQTMLPVWLVWALAETWLAQTAALPRPAAARSCPARAAARPSPGKGELVATGCHA
jgi:hypothetical protein